MGANVSRRQDRLGYVYLSSALAPIVVVVAMVLFFSYPPKVLLGAVPPVAVLALFGYRALADTEDGSEARRERTGTDDAANWALMILFGTITADGFLELFPGEGRPVIYLAVGSATFFVFYVYYALRSRASS